MPFHVHAMKYSPEGVLPSARMLCLVVDEIPQQEVVKCTCCPAMIKICEKYTCYRVQAAGWEMVLCAQRGLCSHCKANAFGWFHKRILAFECTPLKGDSHGEELAWGYEVAWKRRQAQRLNFGLSVLYYESEEVDWRARNNYQHVSTWDGWISQFQIKIFLCLAAVYPTCNADTNSSSDPHSCEAINPCSYLCSSHLLFVLRRDIGFQEGSPTTQSHWHGGEWHL